MKHTKTTTACLDALLTLAVAIGVAGCNAPGSVVSDSDAGTVLPERTPAALRIRIDSEARAGELVRPDCRVVDAAGVDIPGYEDALEISFGQTGQVMRAASGWAFARAGTVLVRCGAPSLNLDDVSAPVAVTAGPLALVRASVDQEVVIAGQSANVTCSGEDAYGNRVSVDAVQLAAYPGPVFSSGLQIGFTIADTHQVHCYRDGVASVSAPVRVLPALPAYASVALEPDLGVYAQGEVVQALFRVEDRFGNVVPQPSVAFTTSPAVPTVGDSGAFRFTQEGFFRVSGRFMGATDGGVPLQAEARVPVNGGGPQIHCDDDVMRTAVPGQPYVFSGRVLDGLGVTEVSVNGLGVAVGPDGRFSAPVPHEFGMNFMRVDASDLASASSSRLCTLLLSERFVPEDALVDSGAMIGIRQPGLDDSPYQTDAVRARAAPHTSLADVVHVVVNSEEIVDVLRERLEGEYVASGSECLSFSAFGQCIGVTLRYDVKLEELRGLSRDNWVTMELQEGGVIHIEALFRDIEVLLDAETNLGDHSIGADVSSAWVALDARLVVNNGRFGVEIVPGAESNLSFSVNTDIPDWIEDIGLDVIDWFYSIEGRVADELVGILEEDAAGIVAQMISSVDFERLVDGLPVPHPLGPPVPLSLGFRAASANTTTTSVTLGVETRLHATRGHARPSAGIAIPTTSGAVGSHVAGDVFASVHPGVINQALHALWRGGYFDVELEEHELIALGESLVGGVGLPAGFKVNLAAVLGGLDFDIQLSTVLPPVVDVPEPDELRIGVGGMRVRLRINGQTFFFDFGARLRVGADVSGDQVRVRLVALEDVAIILPSQLDSVITPTQVGMLENAIVALVEAFLIDVLNAVVPAVTLPSLQVPEIAAQLGVSGRFRLRNLAVGLTNARVQVGGGFSLTP